MRALKSRHFKQEECPRRVNCEISIVMMMVVVMRVMTATAQARCMDLVSLETEAEWRLVRARMEEAGAKFIWTSGHICDRDVGQRSVWWSFYEDNIYSTRTNYGLTSADASLTPASSLGWSMAGSGPGPG